MFRPSETPPVGVSSNIDLHELPTEPYFVENRTFRLASYYESSFWHRIVLPAGQSEPAVRHAVAAIGALHEMVLSDTLQAEEAQHGERTRFALEQCNKSIQHLVQSAVSPLDASHSGAHHC